MEFRQASRYSARVGWYAFLGAAAISLAGMLRVPPFQTADFFRGVLFGTFCGALAAALTFLILSWPVIRREWQIVYLAMSEAYIADDYGDGDEPPRAEDRPRAEPWRSTVETFVKENPGTTGFQSMLLSVAENKFDGLLDDVSKRALDRAGITSRYSTEADTLIAFLEEFDFIRANGQVFVWTPMGDRVFPPPPPAHSPTRENGSGGTRVATTHHHLAAT